MERGVRRRVEYSGKVTAYDNPIYIADAALYLMNTQPDLGIENPYALDQEQLDAAVAVLKNQKASIGEYWSDYLKEIQAFKTGSSVIGTTWEIIGQPGQGRRPVEYFLPDEGSTGWSDTWMVGTESQHKNCAYLWLDWISSPEVQAQVAEWFGEAPANVKACDFTTIEGFCDDYHVSDEAYADQIWYWTTPIKECLDGRDTECTDYQEWTDAWTEIKGEPATTGRRYDGYRCDGAGDGARLSPRAAAGVVIPAPPPRSAGGRAGLGTAALARLDLSGRPGGPVRHGVLEGELRHRCRARVEHRQLPKLYEQEIYRTVVIRTIWLAALVTVLDALLALPVAFFMAKVARGLAAQGPGGRHSDAAVGQLPGQGVRVAGMVQPGGVLDSAFGWTPGSG